MNKLSTADCRRFIVAFVSANPDVILSNWSDPDELAEIRRCLTSESKWKRMAKWRASGDHDFAEPEYTTYDRSRRISAEQLTWVREFYLNPSQFETAIGFRVLEAVNGDLILGEDIGD